MLKCWRKAPGERPAASETAQVIMSQIGPRTLDNGMGRWDETLLDCLRSPLAKNPDCIEGSIDTLPMPGFPMPSSKDPIVM